MTSLRSCSQCSHVLKFSDCHIVTKVFEEDESVDESKEGSDKLSRTESSKSFESFGEEVISAK